jgi:peptidoglycan/xylan/chitin deacetylase (PgdA/CDA1 family)
MRAWLRTLVYHRVAPTYPTHPDLAPELVSATPELFARQLRHLTRFYAPVDAAEVLTAIDGNHRLPPRAVVVTFDDGYRDFADVAWPLLKESHVPCILFVSTGYASDPTRLFWWDALWQVISRTSKPAVELAGRGWLPIATEQDRRHAYRLCAESLKIKDAATRREMLAGLGERLNVEPQVTDRPPVLAWPELRRLVADGLTVAPHGRFHELLDQVDGPTLTNEVVGARDDVRQQLDTCPPLFAYPNGNFDARTTGALCGTGYRAAFTTIAGVDALPTRHPLLLRREQGYGSPAKIALKLAEPVAVWRTMRRPLPAWVS